MLPAKLPPGCADLHDRDLRAAQLGKLSGSKTDWPCAYDNVLDYERFPQLVTGHAGPNEIADEVAHLSRERER